MNEENNKAITLWIILIGVFVCFCVTQMASCELARLNHLNDLRYENK